MNYNLKLQAYKISQIAVDTKLIKDGKEELAIECFVSPKFPLNGDDDTLLLAFNASVYEKDKKDAEKIVSATAEFIYECNMHPETVGLIVNRAPKGELNDGIKEEIEKQGLHLLGVVPQDETVYEYDCEGRPTASLPEDNPVKVALKEIIKNLNL